TPPPQPRKTQHRGTSYPLSLRFSSSTGPPPIHGASFSAVDFSGGLVHKELLLRFGGGEQVPDFFVGVGSIVVGVGSRVMQEGLYLEEKIINNRALPARHRQHHHHSVQRVLGLERNLHSSFLLDHAEAHHGGGGGGAGVAGGGSNEAEASSLKQL
ncbi:hypothetical protein Taro_013560, partial [Colocasia esculenta]|nr:hypothetical protein [Colocasia esculenta]